METKIRQREQKLAQLVDKDTVYHPNFFSFEGGEGSGKSTVLKAVSAKLAQNGWTVFTTREPGGNGSKESEAIRELILADHMRDMQPLTGAYLYAASRAEHVRTRILPKIAAGSIVLADRYVDSSLVYQGMQASHLEEVIILNKIAIAQTMPICTIFFDVQPEIGLQRIFSQRSEEMNYLDKRDLAFHHTIYQDFQLLSQVYASRYTTVDASQPLDQVIEVVYKIMTDKLSSACL